MLMLDLGYKKKLTTFITKIKADIIILGFVTNILSLFTPIPKTTKNKANKRKQETNKNKIAKGTEAEKRKVKNIRNKRRYNAESGNKIYHGNQSFTNL